MRAHDTIGLPLCVVAFGLSSCSPVWYLSLLALTTESNADGTQTAMIVVKNTGKEDRPASADYCVSVIWTASPPVSRGSRAGDCVLLSPENGDVERCSSAEGESLNLAISSTKVISGEIQSSVFAGLTGSKIQVSSIR